MLEREHYNNFRPGSYIDWTRDTDTGDLRGAGYWIYDTVTGDELELVKFIPDTKDGYISASLGTFSTETRAQYAAEKFEFLSLCERARLYPQTPLGELILFCGLAFLTGAMIGAGFIVQVSQ